jgi:hypothetical protein
LGAGGGAKEDNIIGEEKEGKDRLGPKDKERKRKKEMGERRMKITLK